MWQDILSKLDMVNLFITAITVPVTIVAGFNTVRKRCRKYVRQRYLRRLLGTDKVLVHIPSRNAVDALGEKRLKTVVAREDYNTFEKLKAMLLAAEFEVDLAYIPPDGEIELKKDCANIVVCGPRNSGEVQKIFDEMENFNFQKDDEGWYFEVAGGERLYSPLEENKEQYAFLGKIPVGSRDILLVCGIHAIGSDGVAHLLGDGKQMKQLLQQVGDDRFCCLIKSSYEWETKDVYDAELVQLVCKEV